MVRKDLNKMNDEVLNIKKEDEIYCPECGKVVKRNSVDCVSCGAQVKPLETIEPKRQENKPSTTQNIAKVMQIVGIILTIFVTIPVLLFMCHILR